MYRILIASLLAGLLAGQQKPPAQQPAVQQPATQPPAAQPEPAQDPSAVFRSGVSEVQAPVLVLDRDGQYVSGLQPEQFHLFDNGKEQNIHVDVSYLPISLVICIQANQHVESLMPEVRRIGVMIAPVIIGDQGEAAVVVYDSRVRVLQPFTNEADKITESLKKLNTYGGSTSNRMVDAVNEATRLLKTRPKERRRIIMMIGETRDLGSETRLREALLDLQFANVLFYGVDMPRLMTTLAAPQPVGRTDNLPPAMYPLPGGVASTPTSVQQTYGTNGGRAEFIPMMVEIFKDVKAIFKDNPVEAFTKGTGGSEFSFYKQRGLQDAIQRIGAELHSQYLVSYTPNNMDEGGFHEIQVAVSGAPEVKKAQTRPGYWLSNVK
jgi:VWFA-related protein